MKTKQQLTWILGVALMLCVPTAWAQQKDPRVSAPAKPVQPIGTEESSSRTAPGEVPGAVAAAPAQKSNTPPVTSAEPWSLGILGGGRNFLVPSLSVGLTADSNPGLAGSGSTVGMVGFVSGQIQFQRMWATRQLTGSYSTGMEFNSRNSDLNGGMHAFGVSYSMQKGRWGYVFSDNASYSRQTRGTFGGQMLPGVNPMPGNISGGYNVLPTILTQRAGRITNTFMGEARYMAGRRSAITVTGSYGLLHFLESGFINAKTGSFGSGYNYSLTGKDTLGLSYQGSLVRFDNGEPGVNTNGVFVSYGRVLTGRLTLRASGGAQFSSFGDGLGGRRSLVFWSVQNALQYQMAQSSLGVTYSRGVTEGSGIFAGAVTHNVMFNYGRQLSRMWTASFGGGYARNELLGSSGLPGTAVNTWIVRTGVSRPVGRYANLGFRYDMQRQIGGGLDIGSRHLVGVVFNFRFRPIDID